ncbi:peptidase M24, structural domain-containing protein [Chaetomium fimeti]|uniref:Xaa-Pro aminopeptidase n=1 Tax=Chaetomium fimeti TaxID=1854472 RepID=A0AAE0HGK8_9PEZI|nr:peptidase M24, structural domain-containing protein [Chaetomium fimeti]
MAAVNEPCVGSGGRAAGVCISTTSCKSAGGVSISGACPADASNIKCCTKASCANGSAGNCRWQSDCGGKSVSNKCPGPSQMKCCSSGTTGFGGYKAPAFPAVGACKSVAVSGAKKVVAAWKGRVRQIYCTRDCACPGTSDHCCGKAIDFMCSDGGGVPTSSGRQIAEWVMNNRSTLKLKYVIWGQRIWNPSVDGVKPWTKWRAMEDRGDITQNHWIFRSPRLFSPIQRRAVSSFRTMDYDTILQGKYPAKQHAKRVVDYIRTKVPDATGVLYLESRMTKLLEDNDEPEPFRQRRFFYYLTGCPLADSFVVHDMDSAKTILFIPPINPESVIWSGLPVSAEEALQKYDVDEIKYTTDINAELAHAGAQKSKSTVFAIPGQVSEHVTFLGFDNKNFAVLKEAIEVSRVVKDEFELAMMAKANAVSADAHLAVMKKVKHAKNERELEAEFIASSIAAGAPNQSYHGIFAAGRAAATLHYVHNNAPLAGKLNLLLDGGAEWDCYASDITRTFPINGKFTKESRAIYDIVLKMQLESIAALKEDVLWDDVHLLAHKIAIDGLLELGILKGDKEEILASRTSVAFFPHGLGHYLGMDTHDTGGNPNYADEDTLFRYLRVRGKVPVGSVVTVEPGIYFCSFIIEPYLKNPKHSKYIDAEVLENIEDNLVITKGGAENLTTTLKDPDEMERIISSS